MKKLLLVLFGLALGAGLFISTPVGAQVTGSLWKLSANYLYPINSTWGLAVPSLANNNCIGTDSSGKFQAGTCTGGSSFPFTPNAWGNSTSTVIGFTQGIITNASTTFAQLATGALYDQNGLILAHATTSTSVASQDVWRDGNANVFANNFIPGLTSTVSNGGTTVLTPASTRYQLLTGSAAYTFQMPNGNASGMNTGATWEFNNNSTGVLHVQTHGGAFITDVPAGGFDRIILTDNSTSEGAWETHALLGHSNVSGTGALGLSTTTPYAQLSVHASDGNTYKTLFSIGSSTSLATTTLFSIGNTGTITTALTGYNGLAVNSLGQIVTAATTTAGTGLSYSAGAFNVTGLTTTQFSSANVSQWTNDANYLTAATYANTIATTSGLSISQLATYTKIGGVTTLGGVATGTVSAGSSAITVTAGRSAIGGALAIDCATAGSGQNGCLSSTDWSTFNNKQATIAVTAPLRLTGATIDWTGLATTSQPSSSNLLVSNGLAGVYGVATTSATCTGSASCSPFTVIGSSPVTISASGGGTFPFSPTTNFGQNVQATTTALWLQGSPISLMASSTAWFDQINVGSSTSSTMSTSTFFGNINVVGAASSTLFYAGNGSGSVPSYTFANDTNTGIYSEGSDILGFVAAGAVRGDVSSNGFSVKTNGSAASVSYALAGSTSGFFSANITGIGFGIAGVEAARITPGIYTGFGTTTPHFLLQLASSTQPQLALSDGTATSNHWTLRSISNAFYIATASPSTYGTSTIPALAIDANGGVAIGTSGTNAAPALRFWNDTQTGFYRSATDVIGITAAGTIVGSLSSTGISANPSGSAAAPSLSFSGTTNGFFGSANSFGAFSVAGTEVWRTTTGLYTGFGTSSPKWLLQLATSSAPQLTFSDASSANNHFSWRAINNWLFLGTSSPLTFATSTRPIFTISPGGEFGTQAQQPATSTAITLDWSNTPNQVEYEIGTSATTITLINATTTDFWGSTKRVMICNPSPSGTAGALTFVGVEWVGAAAPTQTTTAQLCDLYSFLVTRATSTPSSPAYKVFGAQSAGFN